MSEANDGSNDQENTSTPPAEAKQTPTYLRVITVCVYLAAVSTAAIFLSIYYIFFWNPKPYYDSIMTTTTPPPLHTPHRKH